MEGAKAVILLLLLAELTHVYSLPITAPAFLWSPHDYGLMDNGAKEVVNYQTLSPKDLAKSVLEEGGWSDLVCSKGSSDNKVDIALVFVGRKLHSSDISKTKQLDPTLTETLKLSFSSSRFSMAFPYVALSESEGEERETLESSLFKGFSESCGNSDLGLKISKLEDMKSVDEFVVSRMETKQAGQTDMIVYCNEGFKELTSGKSEGEVLSELVGVLERSGAKYTVLYASEPYSLAEYRAHVPLTRFLAEKGTSNASTSNSTICDQVCKIKASLLEGTLVGLVLLIILISGLCCMMGIDTPTRFETPQES